MGTALLRLGIAGLEHDHVWGELRHWRGVEGVEIVAAADPNQPLLDKVREEQGVDRLYRDAREMIDREDLQLLQIAGDNASSADVVEYAAPRGIHMIVEKPMAATLEQADRMLAAVEKAGVLLLVNWPTAWKPEWDTALRRAAAGDIGQVYTLRTRMSHCGPKEIGCSPYFYGWLYDEQRNGGGAIMDYCCYGANTCCHLLGRPLAVQGVRATLVKPDFPVDDNAIITLIYDRAFGILEASWTQIPGIHDLWIHGSEGMLWTDHGQLKRADNHGETLLEPEPLPVERVNGPTHLVHCVRTGATPFHLISARNGRNAQEVLQAGKESADTGRRISLPH